MMKKTALWSNPGGRFLLSYVSRLLQNGDFDTYQSELTSLSKRFAVGVVLGFSLDIVEFRQLGCADKALWREWQATNPLLASPFFRLEFSEIASTCTPHAFIARILWNAELIGFYPFQRRGSAIYPIAAPMNDYHGIIGISEHLPSLAQMVTLLNAKRMVANSWVAKAAPTDNAAEESQTTLQVVMPDNGFDAWYEEQRSRHAKYIKDKERAKRSMEAQLGTMVVVTDVKSQARLDQLLSLKSAQYKRTGKHDIFGVSWTRDLLAALLAYEGDGFGASIATLSAGGEVLAIEYSLYSGSHYHFWFPVYVELGARYSPGILLSVETMRLVSSEGYRVFDYGFAGEGYKKYLTNHAQQVAAISTAGRGASAALARGVKIGLKFLPDDKAAKLSTSARHRWAAIEATETNRLGRIRGIILASQRAVTRLADGVS